MLFLAICLPARADTTTPSAAFLAAWHQATDQPDNARAAWQSVADQYPKDELGQLAQLMVVVTLLRQGDASDAAGALPTEVKFSADAPANPSAAQLRKQLPDAVKGLRARIRLLQMSQRLQTYYDRHVEYPAALDDLVSEHLAKPADLTDPFGQPYAYETRANSIVPDTPRQQYSLTCTTLKLEHADAAAGLTAQPSRHVTISSLDPKAGEAYVKMTRPDGSLLPTTRIPLGQEFEEFTLWGVYDQFIIVGWQKIPRVVIKE